jgi:hypothetical protein
MYDASCAGGFLQSPERTVDPFGWSVTGISANFVDIGDVRVEDSVPFSAT